MDSQIDFKKLKEAGRDRIDIVEPAEPRLIFKVSFGGEIYYRSFSEGIFWKLEDPLNRTKVISEETVTGGNAGSHG